MLRTTSSGPDPSRLALKRPVDTHHITHRQPARRSKPSYHSSSAAKSTNRPLRHNTAPKPSLGPLHPRKGRRMYPIGRRTPVGGRESQLRKPTWYRMPPSVSLSSRSNPQGHTIRRRGSGKLRRGGGAGLEASCSGRRSVKGGASHRPNAEFTTRNPMTTSFREIHPPTRRSSRGVFEAPPVQPPNQSKKLKVRARHAVVFFLGRQTAPPLFPFCPPSPGFHEATVRQDVFSSSSEGSRSRPGRGSARGPVQASKEPCDFRNS
ncbi:hypothetical protein LZ30DRAFT_178654 [Colletotrichum cereale]|nr:hypothetical protein LZ30DRAFT_178654 [Colletotrichum cereale]